MRYIKVLLLAIFLFLAFIFFYQNQVPLSQQMELTMNLFFIPPMVSIPLPFYFIVAAAFLLGCLMTLAMLIWDKFHILGKLMHARVTISRLQNEVDKLKASQQARAAAAAARQAAQKPDGQPVNMEKRNREVKKQ